MAQLSTTFWALPNKALQKRDFHNLHASTPCNHCHGNFVLFAMEDWDLFLVNLQNRSMCCDDLGCCVIGHDLLLPLLVGSGGVTFAGQGCRVVHLYALASVACFGCETAPKF